VREALQPFMHDCQSSCCDAGHDHYRVIHTFNNYVARMHTGSQTEMCQLSMLQMSIMHADGGEMRNFCFGGREQAWELV
jgi:hypothetical protein